MLDNIEAQTFEGREKLREQWCMVHGSLPDELCRSHEDMKEMLTRVANGQPLFEPVAENGKIKKRVRFEDGVDNEIVAKVLDPLYKLSDMSLSPLGAKSSVDGWVEIEITIDSGACDTVMPTSWCSHISILQSEDSRRGVEYEVANGETIPNLGERHCCLMSEGSNVMKKIVFQTADIHKPLLSISRCADLGYRCTLDRHGGELVDNETGESIPVHRRGNLYIMRAWIKQDKTVEGFVRPQ
jgi:hypothetical protein